MARRRLARKPVVVNAYVRVLRDSREDLLHVQAKASQELVSAHAALRKRLDPSLDALCASYGRELARVRAEATANGDDPSTARVAPFWLNTLAAQGGGQWPMLAALISHEMRTYGQEAHRVTRDALEEAADIGGDGAQAAMRAALLPIAQRLRRAGHTLKLKHPGGRSGA
jgi:hypothetical protein